MYFNHTTQRRKKRFFIFSFILLAIFGVGIIIMNLWNAILPDLIHVSKINYWQSIGLFILCRLLFGGFRFGGRHRHFEGRQALKEKMMNMSDEEKQVFKEKWKERCGHWKDFHSKH